MVDKVSNTFYKQSITYNIMFKVVLFLATIHKASKSTAIEFEELVASNNLVRHTPHATINYFGVHS
jgi:hypothetical protein